MQPKLTTPVTTDFTVAGDEVPLAPGLDDADLGAGIEVDDVNGGAIAELPNRGWTCQGVGG